MFLIGGGTTVWLIAAKLYKQAHALPLRPVTDQPLFYLAMLAVVLGVQLFLAGFLGELVNRGSSERNKYLSLIHISPTKIRNTRRRRCASSPA